MTTYFDVLRVPKRTANQTAEQYNQILCSAFERSPVTDARTLAYMVLTRQYDIYVQLHCSKTLYEVLGVTRTANEADIKKAYRQLSLKVHPDRWMTAELPLQQQATLNQSRVMTAFQVLSTHRTEYDKAGCPATFDKDATEFDDASEFEDDAWAASESEAEESSAESSEEYQPPPKRPQRGGAGRGRGGAARGAGRGGTARGRGRGATTPEQAPPPPEADGLVCKKVITASLFQLYRGFTAAVLIETSVLIDNKWVQQSCHMQIPIPARTGPGLVKILRKAGVYRPGLHVREDVHIIVNIDDVVWPFAVRGQDLIVNHTIDLSTAIRGTGVIKVTMPSQELEEFVLADMVHELQEIAYQGRGLKYLDTGFVGCVILRMHVKYPTWTVEQRADIADYMTMY